LQAWDDDILVDKQWDLSPTKGSDHAVTFDILTGTGGFTSTSGEGTDRDAFLSFQIVPVRQPRISTVFVDSLDVDDLVTAETGDLRYLGDQVFYVAWIEATTARDPFAVGLNAIIIPRPQFLNSSANHTLRTTTNGSLLPDHLRTLSFTAFDDASSETTNAIARFSHFEIRSCTAAHLRARMRGSLHPDLIKGKVPRPWRAGPDGTRATQGAPLGSGQIGPDRFPTIGRELGFRHVQVDVVSAA
jgi:hypothetical protein